MSLEDETRQLKRAVLSDVFTRAAHDSFRNLLPDTIAAIAVDMSDPDMTIIAATREADILFGYIEGQLVGLSLEQLIPAEFLKQHREHFAKFASDPRRRPMGKPGMKFWGKHRLGQQFPVQIALDARMIGGKPCGIAVIVPQVSVPESNL